jgi:predicted membrane-bound mannosyltransferase
MPAAESSRLRWGLAVAALLAGAFALRVWGARHGLPYAYNADENAHFVPKAIQLFDHGWNPHYFVNPPAYTYLLHLVFDVWFGGRTGVSDAFADGQTEVFVVARVTAAFVGTLAVWLLYLAGAKLFDRRTGLLAAGILAVSFLPVFYSHLALNDVPTLAPICLSLWGTAGILRSGRIGHYALAGAGLGLACATKYTGGIVLLPLLGAGAIRLAAPGARGRALAGLVLAGALALAAFFVANPYAFLDYEAFREGLRHQSTVADDALGKLGLTQSNGIAY